MKVKNIEFKKTDEGWKFVEEIVEHPSPEGGYEFVDIDTTLDDVLEKIKQKNVSVIFKIHFIASDDPSLKYKELSLYDKMRDEMKEDEEWEALLDLDRGVFPVLKYEYEEDPALINEIIDAIKTGQLAFNNTCIDFLKEGQSEFYSGTKDNIKMVMKHKQRKVGE